MKSHNILSKCLLFVVFLYSSLISGIGVPITIIIIGNFYVIHKKIFEIEKKIYKIAWNIKKSYAKKEDNEGIH